ncbi:Spore germination protein YndE [compost metagenome]
MIRLFGITLPITLFLFIIGILLSSKMFDMNNLRPVPEGGLMPILRGIQPAVLSFSGYEMMLFLTAYITNPKESFKTVFWSVLIVTTMFTFTMVMVLGGLSLTIIENRTFPTIDLLRSYEIQGLFFERFESLFLVFWIMQIFTTYNIKYYFASVGIQDLFRIKKLHIIIYLLLPLIYILASLPKDLDESLILGDILGNMSILLFGITPLILSIISVIRQKINKATAN